MKTLHGLSAGRINLNTGKTKYFNVLENNGPDDALVLIESSGKYTVVSGSGRGYDEFADGRFISMESQGRVCKTGHGVAEYPNTMEGLTQIKEKIGTNKCSFWVFK